MNVEQLAAIVIDACEAEQVAHMLTGAFASSFYGVPRSTSDVDLVIDLEKPERFVAIREQLSGRVRFDPQCRGVQTWIKTALKGGAHGTEQPPPSNRSWTRPADSIDQEGSATGPDVEAGNELP